MTRSRFEHFPLKAQRAHEVQGAGGYFFAFTLAAQLGGTVIWIRESWHAAQLHPNGFADVLEPRDLLVAHVKDQLELLASAEEALRSGAVNLVVMELTKPIGLTEGRRLQLAARDGTCCALAIVPEGAGSNAAETRWHCTPMFDETPSDDALHPQRWALVKNKSGALGEWVVRWDQAARRVVMMS